MELTYILGAVGCFYPPEDIAAIYYCDDTIVGFFPSTLGLRMEEIG